MARLNIDTGTEGNVATGDTLRTAMTKINNNFIDVYGLVGDPSTGLLIVINTTKTATAIGSAGDVAGSIAWNSTNLYVCTANYDGSTAVWKKLVLQAI